MNGDVNKVGGYLLVVFILIIPIAGIVGGVWLLLQGQWKFVLLGLSGVVVFYLVPRFLSFLLTLFLFFMATKVYVDDNRRSIIMLAVVGIFSNLCMFTLVACWAIACWMYTSFFTVSLNNSFSLIPYLLWCFTITMLPYLISFRNVEPENFSSYDALMFAGFCFIILTISLFFGTPWLLPIIVVGIIFSLLLLSLTYEIMLKMNGTL